MTASMTGAEITEAKATQPQNSSKKLLLDIAIVGGGIAGLATAAALRQAGHKITVYEQSRFLNEVGAAIHLAPNAARVLQFLGFESARARGVQNKWSYHADGITLDTRWSKSLDYIEKEYKTPWLMFHRVDLHEELKRLAFGEGPGQPAVLKLGTRVTAVDIEASSLTLQDGQTVMADAIIGADGVHSKIVPVVTGSESAAFPTGQAAFRFLIPIADLLKDKETAWLVENKPATMNIFTIEDRRIACYPCRDSTLFNFVAIHPERSEEEAVEDWNVSTSLQSLLDTYSMFHPSLQAVMKKALALQDLKLWKLLSRQPLPHWVKGNVCLIGDAAHPMLPHSGQGGGQSIEDAACLGVLLGEITSKSEIPRRLEAYESLRFRRASAIQVLSNHGQDQAYKSQQQARAYIDGHIPCNQREIHDYIYSYFILEESRKCLQKIKEGEFERNVNGHPTNGVIQAPGCQLKLKPSNSKDSV